MTMDRKTVEKYFKDNKENALKKTGEILKEETTWSSFNGTVGGKNRTYGVELEEHDTPESYIEAWMKGHKRAYYSDDNPSYNKFNRSSHTVHALLQDDFLKEFIVIFLARTYFNNKKVS
ncbi:topoisomerase [Bacillus cereus]|uniref:Topoisomerase n=1 Tax=Bacillus cereus TaxID=1396 RepID=A0A2B9DHE4_BACCE|nr:topoisomerase [Bacillus cereus]PGM87985.1 topoisomerase [Bacillus cereus]